MVRSRFCCSVRLKFKKEIQHEHEHLLGNTLLIKFHILPLLLQATTKQKNYDSIVTTITTTTTIACLALSHGFGLHQAECHDLKKEKRKKKLAPFSLVVTWKEIGSWRFKSRTRLEDIQHSLSFCFESPHGAIKGTWIVVCTNLTVSLSTIYGATLRNESSCYAFLLLQWFNIEEKEKGKGKKGRDSACCLSI